MRWEIDLSPGQVTDPVNELSRVEVRFNSFLP
jgi:hypothetical protein